MHYYDRERPALDPWYVWPIVLWMTMLTWLLGQFAFTSPFQPMLAEIDPKAARQASEMMLAEAARNVGQIALLGLGSVLALVGSLTAVIALMIHFNTHRSRPSLITGLIGVFVTFIGLVPVFMANSAFAESSALLMTVIGLSPVAYALMLLTFPAALAGLYFGWVKVQERTLTSLHTAFARFRWGRVVQSFVIGWAVLGTFTLAANALGLSSPRFVFDAARFLPFALVSLLLLPVQSATEEIVVRGFMNKGLIRFLGNKWVAFTLTSGLFMALHLANPEARSAAEGGVLPIVMSGYFFFGFAACLMVLIDDGLESAIGVHAANNTFAAIFVNYEGSVLPTPSIWVVTPDPATDSIAAILVLSVILGLLWVTRKRWIIERPGTAQEVFS